MAHVVGQPTECQFLSHWYDLTWNHGNWSQISHTQGQCPNHQVIKMVTQEILRGNANTQTQDVNFWKYNQTFNSILSKLTSTHLQIIYFYTSSIPALCIRDHREVFFQYVYSYSKTSHQFSLAVNKHQQHNIKHCIDNMYTTCDSDSDTCQDDCTLSITLALWLSN